MSGPRGRVALQLAILRDEVLLTSEHGETPPGAAYFDAIVAAVQLLESPGQVGSAGPGPGLAPGSEPIDRMLAAALDTQLAQHGPDATVLAEADATFDRLIVAVDRALVHPADVMLVVARASATFAQLAGHVSRAAIARAGRDRSERVRQELIVGQLEDALTEQAANLERLRADLAGGDQ